MRFLAEAVVFVLLVVIAWVLLVWGAGFDPANVAIGYAAAALAIVIVHTALDHES